MVWAVVFVVLAMMAWMLRMFFRIILELTAVRRDDLDYWDGPEPTASEAADAALWMERFGREHPDSRLNPNYKQHQKDLQVRTLYAFYSREHAEGRMSQADYDRHIDELLDGMEGL